MAGERISKAEAYARLEDWISGSLERHKPTLFAVRFPLFCNIYLALLGEEGEASAFLARWGPDLSAAYPWEMRSLAALTRPEDIGLDEFTKSVSPGA